MAKRFDISTMPQYEVDQVVLAVIERTYAKVAVEMGIGRGTLFDGLESYRQKIRESKKQLKEKKKILARHKPAGLEPSPARVSHSSEAVEDSASSESTEVPIATNEERRRKALSPTAENGNSTGVELVKPLPEKDTQRLAHLEHVIDAKLGDFLEVGEALIEIKTRELFRGTHSNFGAYCQDRWGFGRSYANKLIGSAERVQLLPPGIPKPTTEFQVRPFLKLEPKEFPKKWEDIVKAAGVGKVTGKLVQSSLALPAKKPRTLKRKQTRVPKLFKEIRAALTQNNIAAALRHVGRLERLLW